MKNLFTFLICLAYMAGAEVFAQSEDNQIAYQLSITNPTDANSFLICSGKMKEGSFFTFPKFNLSNNEYERFQKFYAAIEGSRFGFAKNSTDNDIEILIDIKYFDFNSGKFQKVTSQKDDVFLYFEVTVHDLKTDQYFSEDDSYYFNRPDAAYFEIPKSEALYSYLSENGFGESTEKLKFGYIINNSWDTDGIVTIDSGDYFGFRAAHFSRFGGGRGNSILSPKTLDSKTNNENPTKFFLSQNYPNPFNPSTKIEFGIAEDSDVQLKIYNILGIEVVTLVDEYLTSGNYTAVFDGWDAPSGIYFYELNDGSATVIKKMTLLK